MDLSHVQQYYSALYVVQVAGESVHLLGGWNAIWQIPFERASFKYMWLPLHFMFWFECIREELDTLQCGAIGKASILIWQSDQDITWKMGSYI